MCGKSHYSKAKPPEASSQTTILQEGKGINALAPSHSLCSMASTSRCAAHLQPNCAGSIGIGQTKNFPDQQVKDTINVRSLCDLVIRVIVAA